MNKELSTTLSEIKSIIYYIFKTKDKLTTPQSLLQLIKEEMPQLLTIFAQKLDTLEAFLENFFERKNGK